MTVYHGSQVKVAAKATNDVAFTDADGTTDISVELDRDLEEVYIHGDAAPQELKSGHYKISGTLTRDFETGNFSAAGATLFAMATGTTEYYIGIFPEGDASPKFLISQLKFSSYGFKAPLKGVASETAKFKGLAIALS